MPISINTIRQAATRTQPLARSARTLIEAKSKGLKTAFLCHSHKDRSLIDGVITLLQEEGWMIYVDWTDSSMPETPNRETAEKIKTKITELNFFLFLATENSMSSRWCPWEIGYADGKKNIDKIIIIPTTDGYSTHGSEYLELYRRVDFASGGGLAVWEPGKNQGGTWVRNL